MSRPPEWYAAKLKELCDAIERNDSQYNLTSIAHAGEDLEDWYNGLGDTERMRARARERSRDLANARDKVARLSAQLDAAKEELEAL